MASLWLLLLACASMGRAPEPETEKTMQTCEDAWSQLEKRDWTGWSGLPAGCRWDEITARFAPKYEGTRDHYLGTARAAAVNQELLVTGFARPVKAWARDGNVVLVAVDATEADQSLPEQLGEPEGTLDWYFMTTKHSNGALVYADKGVALLANADRSTVLRIYLFSPMSLEDYASTLHHPINAARRLKR